MSALKYWLWLSGTEGVSCGAKAALLKHYGEPERAFFAPNHEFKRISGISEREAEIFEKRDMSRCAFIEDECSYQDISVVTMNDSAYPERLKNIYAPPPVIYMKGKIKSLDTFPYVAVIGTRKASAYGLKMGREIAWQICKCGGGVVSLLTAGIDTQAAKGALLAGGKCIGVLGVPHELESDRLSEDICAHGALISEYPPGTSPRRSFFRERNRIASGISLGVVVVEAPEKSGTRLFANDASEQGKEIFAVPGNADSENSVGTNALIKEGAKLVTNGAEVMEEFQPQYPEIIKISRETCPELQQEQENHIKKAEKQENINKTQEKTVDNKISRGYIDLREQLSSLSEDQLKIITTIDKNAVHIDDIIERTGLPAAKVLAQLTFLEIKGFVKREAGRRISLNIAKK